MSDSTNHFPDVPEGVSGQVPGNVPGDLHPEALAEVGHLFGVAEPSTGSGLSQLACLARDLQVASMCVAAFGGLTDAVRFGVSHWFADVEVDGVFPLPVLPLSDRERAKLTGEVLSEMSLAVTSCVDAGLSDASAFERLAPVLDPLYRELYSLSAIDINRKWEEHRPRDPQEIEMRISLLEAMTGLERSELRRRADEDRELLGVISRAGITLADLGASGPSDDLF